MAQRFCCAPAVAARSYCQTHLLMAYRTPPRPLLADKVPEPKACPGYTGPYNVGRGMGRPPVDHIMEVNASGATNGRTRPGNLSYEPPIQTGHE